MRSSTIRSPFTARFQSLEAYGQQAKLWRPVGITSGAPSRIGLPFGSEREDPSQRLMELPLWFLGAGERCRISWLWFRDASCPAADGHFSKDILSNPHLLLPVPFCISLLRSKNRHRSSIYQALLSTIVSCPLALHESKYL